MTSDAQSSSVEHYCPECDTSYPDALGLCPRDGNKLVKIGSDPLLGQVIDDRFTIKSRLGAGGMGVVYRADQSSIRRDVAIKVIHGRLTQGPSIAKRFLREARLCSRLAQPNIVTVLDFGQSEDGLLYLVMELLEGRTLGSALAQDGPFTIKRMVRVGVQLCEALEAAHSESIIHRDLKPNNVVILDKPAGRDYLKVLDFGLAKSLADDHTVLTQSNAIIGTPAYISPEGVKSEPMDERSDLYSLGVMLYELVCGRLPYAGGSATNMLARHLLDQPHPIPDAVNERVKELIYRMLAKVPDQRPQSAREVLEALEGLRGIESAALPWPTSPPAVGVDSTVASDQGEMATALAESAPEPESAPAPASESAAAPEPAPESAPAPAPAAPESAPAGRGRGKVFAIGGLAAAVLVTVLVASGSRAPLGGAIEVQKWTEPEPVVEPTAVITVVDAGTPIVETVDAAPVEPDARVRVKPRDSKPDTVFVEEIKP